MPIAPIAPPAPGPRPPATAIRRLIALALLPALIGCGAIRPVPAAQIPPASRPAAPTLIPRPAPTATMRPAATPLPTAAASPTPPSLGAVAGYAAYRVRPGDSLELIAQRGGSDAGLIRAYNRLAASAQSAPQVPAQPGRELIIPRLSGREYDLPAEPLTVFHGNTARPLVALTFDCEGTNPTSRQIVELLNAAGARATFFLLGPGIADDPELMAALVAGGHELASHGATHVNYQGLSDEEIAADLERQEAAARAALGPEASLRPFFRFPYGYSDDRTTRAVIASGYLPINWTLDLLDTVGPPRSADFLAARALGGLDSADLPGAIILAHCTPATLAALPLILDGLAERGLALGTLSDVLAE